MEQAEQTVHSREKVGREERQGFASTDKFKDTESLKKAYACLEAAFTRKCQRVRELERLMADNATAVAPNAREEARGTPRLPPSVTAGERTEKSHSTAPVTDESGRSGGEGQRAVADYLLSLDRGCGSPQLLHGGGMALSACNKPQTLAEAGRLAKAYLSK